MAGQGTDRPVRGRHISGARNRAAHLHRGTDGLRRRDLSRRVALSRDGPVGRSSRRAGRLSPARACRRTGELSAAHVRRSGQYLPRESRALSRGGEHVLFRVGELRQRRVRHHVGHRASRRHAAVLSAVWRRRLALRRFGSEHRDGPAGLAVPHVANVDGYHRRMSAASHLGVSPAGYDRRIRQYLPDYDELIAESARALGYSLRSVRLIVDLGVGTAALSRACLENLPTARVWGVDEDRAMLAMAKVRLGRRASRATLVEGSFLSTPIPPCDAIVATYALHHIRS